MKQPKVSTRRVTKKQWDKFVPVKTLAAHLRSVAAAISKLPPGTRGKIALQMEIGKPV